MSFVPDFISNPNYLSLFMIWASGYVFAFSVFRKSTAWKNFDGIMKVVVGLVLGFLIELVIIIPLFYVVTGGLATLSLPTLNSTWIFHSLLILGLSYAIYRSKDVPRAINRYIGVVLFWVFIAFAFAFFGLTFGWLFYTDNIKLMTQQFPLFTFSLGTYLVLGAIFCFIFPKLTADAYADKLRQKRLDQFFRDSKIEVKKSMKYVYFLISCIFVVSLLAAPIDATFSVVTPNIKYFEQGKASNSPITLLLDIETFVGGIPKINTNYSRVVYNYYTILPAKIFDSSYAILLQPTSLQTRNLQIGSGVYGWSELRAFADYKNISLQTLPSENGVKGLNVSYPKNTEPFNVTLAYLDNVVINDLLITAQPVSCNKYNETLYQWIYHFTFTNNYSNYFDIKEIELYGHIYDNENQTAAYIKFNNQNVNRDISGTKMFPYGATIPIGKTVNIEMSFLSPNQL